MKSKIILRIREKILKREYILTLHADEEMDADGLSIFDVEHAILTGKIVEVQRDRKTTERKYRIRGESLHESSLEVVCKIGMTHKLIVITVYLV